jgi:hypothetical protein
VLARGRVSPLRRLCAAGPIAHALVRGPLRRLKTIKSLYRAHAAPKIRAAPGARRFAKRQCMCPSRLRSARNPAAENAAGTRTDKINHYPPPPPPRRRRPFPPKHARGRVPGSRAARAAGSPVHWTGEAIQRLRAAPGSKVQTPDTRGPQNKARPSGCAVAQTKPAPPATGAQIVVPVSRLHRAALERGLDTGTFLQLSGGRWGFRPTGSLTRSKARLGGRHPPNLP